MLGITHRFNEGFFGAPFETHSATATLSGNAGASASAVRTQFMPAKTLAGVAGRTFVGRVIRFATANISASAEFNASGYATTRGSASLLGESKPRGWDEYYSVGIALYIANEFRNNTVYRDGSPIVTLNEGDTYSFTPAAGSVITSDYPIGVRSSATFAPSSIVAGTRFAFYTSRYNPQNFYIYAVEACDYVVKQGTTQIASGSLSAGEVTVVVSDVATSHWFIESTGLISVHKRGASGDYLGVFPSSYQVITWRSSTVSSWGAHPTSVSSPDTGLVVQTGTDPFNTTSQADGSGGDAEQGSPIELLRTRYVLQHAVSDYVLGAVEPTVITVESWNGSAWVTYDTYDFSNASSSVPRSVSVGSVSGADPAFLSAPVRFTGTGPFYLRTNAATDEWTATGYNLALARPTVTTNVAVGIGNDLDELVIEARPLAYWRLSDRLLADTVGGRNLTVEGSPNVSIWSPNLEGIRPTEIIGDPALTNGQNTINALYDDGSASGWRAAMHHAPVGSRGELRRDGSPVGQAYWRWMPVSGDWTGLVGIPDLVPEVGKWYRFSVYIRTDTGYNAYLAYNNQTGGQTISINGGSTNSEWVRVVRTGQAQPGQTWWRPYLYGNSAVNGYLDYTGYMVEGPFDTDPGTAGVADFSPAVNVDTVIPGRGGYRFSGDDYLYTPHDPEFDRTTEDFTLEVWFRMTKAQDNYVRLIGKGDSTNRNYGLWLYPNGTNILFQCYGTPSNMSISGGGNVNDGQWHHVAGTREGTTYRLYVDGVLVGTASNASALRTTTSNFTIGYGGFHSRFDDGEITSAAFYQHALSAAEVQAHYAARNPSALPAASFTASGRATAYGQATRSGKATLQATGVRTQFMPSKTLAGTAGRTFTGRVTSYGTASRAGKATLQISAVRSQLASANPAGKATLSASALATKFGEATRGGISTFSAVGRNTSHAVAVLVGVAGKTFSGNATRFASANIAGAGVQLVVAVATKFASATATGSGSLAASATATKFGVSNMPANAGLLASAVIVTRGTSSMSGSATFSATGRPTALGTLALNGKATQTSNGRATSFGAVATDADATLSVTARAEYFRSVALAGIAGLNSAGAGTSFATAIAIGTATVTTEALAVTTGTATSTATSELAATVFASTTASSTPNATAVLVAAGFAEVPASALLEAKASTLSLAENTSFGRADFITAAELQVNVFIEYFATTSITADSTLATQAAVTVYDAPVLDAFATLVAAGGRVRFGDAVLTVGAELNVTEIVETTSAAALNVTGTVDATGNITAVANVVLSGIAMQTATAELETFGSTLLHANGMLDAVPEVEVTIALSMAASATLSADVRQQEYFGNALLRAEAPTPWYVDSTVESFGVIDAHASGGSLTVGFAEKFATAHVATDAEVESVGYAETHVQLDLAVTAGFDIESEVIAVGEVLLVVRAGITAKAAVRTFLELELNAAAEIETSGWRSVVAVARMSGEADVTAAGARASFGAAELVADSTLSVRPVVVATGAANLAGVGTSDVEVAVTAHAEVSIAHAASLYAIGVREVSAYSVLDVAGLSEITGTVERLFEAFLLGGTLAWLRRRAATVYDSPSSQTNPTATHTESIGHSTATGASRHDHGVSVEPVVG